MTNRRWTIAILAACGAVLAGWDVYVAVHPVAGDTISELTLAAAMRHPIIPFALGVVMGHLFWPQYREPDNLRGYLRVIVGVLFDPRLVRVVRVENGQDVELAMGPDFVVENVDGWKAGPGGGT